MMIYEARDILIDDILKTPPNCVEFGIRIPKAMWTHPQFIDLLKKYRDKLHDIGWRGNTDFENQDNLILKLHKIQ